MARLLLVRLGPTFGDSHVRSGTRLTPLDCHKVLGTPCDIGMALEEFAQSATTPLRRKGKGAGEMPTFKLTSWNVEWMNDWFEPDQPIYRTFIKDAPSRGLVADVRQRVARVIQEVDPEILCIQEGPKLQAQLQHFVTTDLGSAYEVLPTPSRRNQNVWILHKPGIFSNVRTLENDPIVRNDLYQSWRAFYWGDSPELLFTGETETHLFDREPCVAEFTYSGATFRVINCHTKSKFVQGGKSLWQSTSEAKKVAFLKQSLKDRIKISTEAKTLRDHLDRLIGDLPLQNIVLAGDLNDGTGRDLFERWYFYQNLVDVLLGSLLDPEKLMYHVFGVVPADDRYTAVFDDFVDNLADNKILLDHIVCSPALPRRASGLMYEESTSTVERQAWITHSVVPEDRATPSRRADRPSDHRPVNVVFKA